MKDIQKITAISLLIIIFVIPFVFSQVDDSSAATLNIINAPPTITGYSINPIAVINGSSVSIHMNATDGSSVDKKYAVIRLPNGSRITRNLPTNYTTTRVGRHNITFFSNDTEGALSNKTDFFLVAKAKKINLTIIDSNLSGIPVMIKLLVRNVTLLINSTNSGKINLTLPETKYDIVIIDKTNKTAVILKSVNLSLAHSTSFGLDKLEDLPDTQIITYGINNTLPIAFATIVFNYTGLDYTDEDNLVFVKCDNWNFKSESCSGSFVVRSDAVHDTTKHIFTFNTTTFSGFGIRDTGVSTGGTGSGGGHGSGGGSQTVFEIASPLKQIIEEGPAFNPNYRRFPVNVLSIPSQGILFGPALIKGSILGKTSLGLMLIILAFILGSWVNSRTISVSSKDGEFVIKNNSMFKKELSTIFVVSSLEKIPKEASLTFGDKTYAINSFKGEIKQFFRSAVSSGPVMTNIGNKVIFAIKDEDGDFLNLFRNDEVKLKCNGISADNSKIYSINKKHIVDKSVQESLWKMLERKEVSNPVEYFKDLMKAARKANLRNADDLKDYASNIVKILR